MLEKKPMLNQGVQTIYQELVSSYVIQEFCQQLFSKFLFYILFLLIPDTHLGVMH